MFRKSNQSKKQYKKQEVIHFYLQVLKMKKSRPSLDIIAFIVKCYPNSIIPVSDIIREYEEDKD